MAKINQSFIKNVERPLRGQKIHRDDSLRGFGLRVTRGAMSYIVERRVNGVNRRITLGSHSLLTPKAARIKAHKLLSIMASGIDPAEQERKRLIAKVTLQEVLEKYLATRTLRPNTVRSFKQILARCLGDWLDKPIASITKNMVEKRHKELTKPSRFNTSGQAQANVAMERLSILVNFAAHNFEIDGHPIIVTNPVRRLSENRLWHRVPRRQGVVPDHKLRAWYTSVMSLRSKTVRDYLLLLMLTGLRRNEAASLRWTDIDFDARTISIRAQIAKNHKELRLPMTDFLEKLLTERKNSCRDSQFVFPGRSGSHIVDAGHVIDQVRKEIGFFFLLHDLRRTFLTWAERLDTPHFVLKKLVNHTAASDVTAGYIVVDIERIRGYMSRINQNFLLLFGADLTDFNLEGNK